MTRFENLGDVPDYFRVDVSYMHFLDFDLDADKDPFLGD